MYLDRRILAHTSAGWNRDWLTEDDCLARDGQRPDAMSLCQRFTVEYATKQFFELGVLRMPDNSAVLSVPDPITTDNAATAGAVSSILEVIVQQAGVSGVEHLRILLPCPGGVKVNSPVRESFSAFGFCITMHVAELTGTPQLRSVASENRDPGSLSGKGITFRSLPCDVDLLSGSCESVWTELVAAIDAIEAEAMIRPSMPPPTGENLLRLWSLFSDEVRISLGTCCDRIVGVAVLRGTASEPNGNATLEYLGVLSSFRRKGIAGQLLEFAQQPHLDQTVMTTFVDSDNTAAVTFYESTGFAQRELHELWTRTT